MPVKDWRDTIVGLLSERPTPAEAGAGATFYATDTGVAYETDGSAWTEIPLSELTPISAAAIEDMERRLRPPERVFDVEKAPYNAVPDAYFTDGVANATTTFTSASANFTAADVGETIVALRAGPSNFQDLHTTIASVTDSTTVVLANTANRSQSSVRFYISRGGVQSPAIQAAVNDAGAAGGGVVYLPGVGYLGSVSLKNRVTLRGAGRRATMLHAPFSLNAPVVTNDQTVNDSAMFCGVEDMWIDGARARQVDVTTTLASAYSAGGTTLSLTDASAFQNTGSVLIGTNRLHYTAKSGNSLTGVTGGLEGTTDAAGASGATVTQHKAHGISFGANPNTATPTIAEAFDPHFFAKRVLVKNCKGDGIQNWGQSAMLYEDAWVHVCDHFGMRPSFDSIVMNCVADTVGRAGYYIFGSSTTGIANKSFYCGANVPGEGYGYFFEGIPQLEEGTKIWSASNAQDNKADGVYLRNADRVMFSGSCSSNGTGAIGAHAAVKLGGASKGVIDVVCTERVPSPNNAQQNALNVVASSPDMKVRLTHGAVNGSAVGPAVKAGSVQTGIDLSVNGQGGYQIPGYAASYTPNPYDGSDVGITLTGNITINNPAAGNRHQGSRLRFMLYQDATGGRTVTFGSEYKVAWTPNTAANKLNTIEFFFDGVSWVQVASAVGV